MTLAEAKGITLLVTSPRYGGRSDHATRSAHRRGALSRLLLGSTAKDVLERARRPVLVVRDPDTAEARD